MRAFAVFVLLLTAGLCVAAVPWAPAPDVYKLGTDGSIEISDGGGSTSDIYLLSAQDFRDFSFEFDLIARPAGGEKLRAIVVWGVDDANRANRKAFFLPLDTIRAGQRTHFRLLVLDDRSLLYRDGQLIGANAVVYEEPPAAGRVGLLHYFNYNVRYENVKLEPIDATTLPAPTKLKATVLPTGPVRLTWDAASPYADLLRYRLTRDQQSWEATGREFTDRSVRSNGAYTYTVQAVAGDVVGPPATVTVKTGKLAPPLPPRGFTATQRLDGSVRLRWQISPNHRCAGLSLYAADKINVTPLPLKLLAELPDAATEYLARAPRRNYYVVAVRSPDGGQWNSATQPRPTAPAVTPGGGVPAQHPYLLYNTAQMSRVRRALQTKEYEKLLTSLRASADAYLRNPAAVPTGVTDEMGAVTSKLQQMGLYYQALQDERCAQWVHDGLMGYAKLYPTLPDKGKRVKITKTVSGLYEAIFFVPLVCAYDLVYESPCFSAEDRQIIERDLLRPGADLFWVRDYHDPKDGRPGDLHYKCYNFQAWFDSAVGLTGLLLKDPDMVEHAIDGPYGVKHLLAHDVHDDGMFWERSAGYHSFVMQALFPLLEASTHCNLNLYKMTVPDDHNTDREPLINYCAGDGDNGPKSMRLMFDGPFYYTFPDLTWPVVADSGKGPLGASPYYRAAWEHTRDPKYAWLINRGRQVPATPKIGTRDAEAKVWVGWDEQHLYVAADITDQVVRNSHDKPDEVWMGDALWVGLKWRDGKGGPYDFIYGLSPGDFGKAPPVAALFNRFGVANAGVSGGKYAVQKTADGYALELAVPLSELAPKDNEKGAAFVPKEGGKLTADFVLYDCDSKEGNTTKEKMVCWACTNDRYESAEGREITLGPARVAATWALPPATAVIGPKSAVMTDASTSGPNLDDLLYARPPDGGKFDYSGSKFANNGVLQFGSSLFPSSGFALLRQHDYAGKVPSNEGTAVNLTYGPYGGGHGHPDKLSVVVWNNGKHLIPDFGSCAYESVEKAQWTAHTISHNTITVDGKSQYPGLDTDKTWPVDTFEKRAIAKLGFFYADPYLKVAQATCDTVFEGVKLTRTVALGNDQILDVFQVQSEQTHTYDYALHVDAPFFKSSAPLSPLDEPLGKACGYQHIHKAQGSAVSGDPVTTQWGELPGALSIACAGGAPTQLITAQSITTALDKFMPMLILRRQAQSTTFATDIGWSPGGGTCGIADDGWVQGSSGPCHLWIYLSPTPDKSVKLKGGSFTGTMVGTTVMGDLYRLFFHRMREYRANDLVITADPPADLRVDGMFRDARVAMGGKAAHITYRSRYNKPLSVDAKPYQEYKLERLKD